MMTPTNYRGIPLYPRYNLVKDLVNFTLLNYASSKVPISLESIIGNFNDLELRSYEWYCRNMNVTMNYVKNYVAKSEDGSILEINDSFNKTYMILYDSSKMTGRKRFTIAHELGHYLLKHNELTCETVICRGEIYEKEYDILEKEANFFARTLLVSTHLYFYMYLNSGPLNRELIMNIFNVTYTVSINAIIYLNGQEKKYNNSIAEKFKKAIAPYINIHTCDNCSTEFISESPKYCPICGSDKINRILLNSYSIYNDFERSEKMFYNGIEVDEQSKVIKCPVCDNEEVEEGNYCKICSEYLINRCTNDDEPNRGYFDGEICGRLLEGNARYCPHCGAKSTFLVNGLLKSWQESIHDESKEFEPMLKLENNGFLDL